MTLLTTHEIEWQFDVNDLREAEAWLRARAATGDFQFNFAGAEPQTDIYFDSPDWRFFRAGVALRLRREGARVEATLKSFGSEDGALRTRREINEGLASDTNETSRNVARWLEHAPGDVGQRVRMVLGKQHVRQLFEVRTVRQRIAMRREGVQIAEIALDDVTIASARHRLPTKLNRVEVELRSDAPDAHAQLEVFVREFRRGSKLIPAKLSKFEAGLRSQDALPGFTINIGLPATVEAISTTPNPSMRDLAFAVLREHFAAFAAREPGSRLGDDAEDVHRMRVAARKLRAAMSLFRDYLPTNSTRLRNELGWMASMLGGVRDLDVQLGRAQAWHAEDGSLDAEALRSLEGLLHDLREPARARLLRAFNSARYLALLNGYSGMLRDGPSNEMANRPARNEMPTLILKRYVKVREGGDAIDDDSPADELHALRILCKRLRYALEFAAPLYPKAIRNFLPRLVALQDVLGEHQDAYIAIEQMRTLSVARGNELPAHTIESLSDISQRYAARAQELRAAFAAQYRKVKGKAWQQVQRALDEA